MKFIFLSILTFSILAEAQDPNALLRVVVRDEDGRGINGARVAIQSSSLEKILRPADGNGYTEENTPKNIYRIDVGAEGYGSQTQELDLQQMTTLGFNLIKKSDAKRDQATNPNALLRVFVKDRNSKPIAGARGQLRRVQTGEDRPMGTTDGNGYFENNALINDYSIDVTKDGFQPASLEINLDRQATVTIYMDPDGSQSTVRGPASTVTTRDTPPPGYQPGGQSTGSHGSQ